jgi:hypothetical protein
MKKVHRQDASVSRPPRIRPTAAPAPDIAAYTAIARLRSLPAGKVVVIRASAFGAAAAAATPCRILLTSSTSSLCAIPPTNDARPNSTTPKTNTLRRPRMSPIRPPSSSRPPNASA